MSTEPGMVRQPVSGKNWFALIKEAILGSQEDLTLISIDRAIVLLAVPTVLEFTMESLFGVVDAYFVGHLGAAATATVGIVEGLLVIVIAIALGLGIGAAAIVARRIGEHDNKGAAEATFQAIVLAVAASGLIFCVCFPLAPKLLSLMGGGQFVVQEGTTYARIAIGGSGLIVILSLINSVFRGAGDAAVAMRVLWLANGINMCLDPCLIRGLGPFPRLGLTGAAVSTIIGRSIGIAVQLVVLTRGSGRVKIRAEHLRVKVRTALAIMRLAGSGALQFIVSMASLAVMIRLVQSFGDAATAGYTIALRLVVLSNLPSWGLGAAAATLVGQNLGARQPGRATESVWRAGFFNLLLLGSISIIFMLFAPQVIAFFTSDPIVVHFGSNCLRAVSACYVIYAYGVVIIQAFNGAGDTFTPSMIALGCYWIIQLPLAFFLARNSQFGANGAFMAIPVAEVLMSLISIYIFRRGRWKEVQVY